MGSTSLPATGRRSGADSVTGEDLFAVPAVDTAGMTAAIERAHDAFLTWRTVPAPVRGALVKRYGALLTEHLEDLATLVAVEVGKIGSEARGEVQEMIDICDFAVGLSRQLDGRTMPSERPGHRLMETWHPLGVVAVISAFNFPVAVWSWNTALALVCGDTVVWKPSESTPLTAMACSALLARAAPSVGAPVDLNVLAVAGPDAAAPCWTTPGSRSSAPPDPSAWARWSRPGWRPASAAACSSWAATTPPSWPPRPTSTSPCAASSSRPSAPPASAAPPCAGSSPTSPSWTSWSGGWPRSTAACRWATRSPSPPWSARSSTPRAAAAMAEALDQAVAEGGEIIVGGEAWPSRASPTPPTCAPRSVRMPTMSAVVRRETFAPILYVLAYRELAEAVALHNDVPQGLSSSIFTTDQREAERFLAADGSDCGIVNVNIGTSGAEIGGAFGGEKTTGGGRESGSDAWRGYMRRATNTINYSDELPLAQGVRFE